MRTQEQIIADCEKRYTELRAEKERRDKDPIVQRSCRTCRFARVLDKGCLEEWTCHEPLILGFDDPISVGTWRATAFDYGREKMATDKPDRTEIFWKFPSLCGPEKAMWQPKPPKPTLCKRIMEFFK